MSSSPTSFVSTYVNTATAFFNWFVNEINERNAEIKTADMEAADAYVSWYQEETGMNTDGYRKLFGPPSGDNRSQRRGQRQQPKRSTKRQRRKK